MKANILQDMTVICAAAALGFAAAGVITNAPKYLSASMVCGNTSFLVMNLSTNERLRKLTSKQQKLNSRQATLIETQEIILDDLDIN